MSSATLIFVLRELLEQFAAGESEATALPPHCAPFVPALAFGPGLNVEGALLKVKRGDSEATEAASATARSAKGRWPGRRMGRGRRGEGHAASPLRFSHFAIFSLILCLPLPPAVFVPLQYVAGPVGSARPDGAQDQ